MVCNDKTHSHYCSNYQDNQLKGASAIINNPRILKFDSREVQLISKILDMCKIYLTYNKDQFQNPKDILLKVNNAINILNARTKGQKIYLLKPS